MFVAVRVLVQAGKLGRLVMQIEKIAAIFADQGCSLWLGLLAKDLQR